MKKIYKTFLFTTYLIIITSNLFSDDINDDLQKLANNSTLVSVYVIGDYGDHIPLATGEITYFDDHIISILESDISLGSVDINRDEIIYITTDKYFEGSPVIYFKEDFGFQQHTIDDEEVDYIYMGEMPEYSVPETLIPEVLDIQHLLNLLYEQERTVVVTGFDETISIATLGEGSIKSFNEESLIILNQDRADEVDIIYTDILYLEIESSNEYWEYYKVIINSDLTISFQE